MKHLLPAAEVEAAIQALDDAFQGMPQHDLWDEKGKLQCSPAKEERLREIQQRGLAALGWTDLDFLMSCAALTVGSDETVRYLTPRYLKALLSFPQFGWYTAGYMLRPRLETYGFDDWSRDQRLATAEALILMGRAMVLMADELSDHKEADGKELVAWGESRREQALVEAGKRRPKAAVDKKRRGKGLRR